MLWSGFGVKSILMYIGVNANINAMMIIIKIVGKVE